MSRVIQIATRTVPRHMSALCLSTSQGSNHYSNQHRAKTVPLLGFVGGIALCSYVGFAKDKENTRCRHAQRCNWFTRLLGCTDEDFDDDFEGEQDDVEQRMDEVINEDLQDMANTKFGDDRMTKWMREQERYLLLDVRRRTAIETRDTVTEEELAEVDNLFDISRLTECEDKLVELNTYIPNNDEILWRIARLKWEYGKAYDTKQKHKIFHLAHKLAKKATEINPQNGNAHRWTAILVMYKGVNEGIRSSLYALAPMKFHLDKALEINPNDSIAWTFLGNYYYEVTELSWLNRRWCSLVYGFTPPPASYTKALRSFEKSTEVSGKTWVHNSLFIAKCHMKLGRKEEALAILKELCKLPIVTTEDYRVRKEAFRIVEMLENPTWRDKLWDPMLHYRKNIEFSDATNTFHTY